MGKLWQSNIIWWYELEKNKQKKTHTQIKNLYILPDVDCTASPSVCGHQSWSPHFDPPCRVVEESHGRHKPSWSYQIPYVEFDPMSGTVLGRPFHQGFLIIMILIGKSMIWLKIFLWSDCHQNMHGSCVVISYGRYCNNCSLSSNELLWLEYLTGYQVEITCYGH